MAARALPEVNIDDKVFTLKYYVDEQKSHLSLRDPGLCLKCAQKPCLSFCPVGVYRLDAQGQVVVGYQACVECGSCRVACPLHNIKWDYPRGGYGVAYKFG